MNRRRAAVVYNPTKVDIEAVRAVVEREQAKAGWAASLWFETTEDDAGQGTTRRALDEGVDMVIAAGGDGTVRAVAEALAGAGVPIALLPSGTGNLLARNLELTLENLDDSINTAFSGRDRRIDLARIEISRDGEEASRHAYLVMAGVGLDAKMLANTDEELKAKIGWLAYVRAIGAALRDGNRMRLRYLLDGELSHSLRAHTVIIGNCGSLQANILLLPDAAVDDGLLDVVIMRPEGLFNWVQVITKIVWENGVLSRTATGRRLRTEDVRALNYVRGRSLSVRLSRPELIQLDGDGFGLARAFRTWVEPGGLTVRVPITE